MLGRVVPLREPHADSREPDAFTSPHFTKPPQNRTAFVMLKPTCMKPRRSNQTNQALTLLEVVVIVACVAVLAALLLPALAQAKRKADRIQCVNNLDQIGLAYRVWEGDHFGQYPMQASATNNGTIELLRAGVPTSQLLLWNFMVMSNELGTPKALLCPSDTHPMADSFNSGFSSTNISYFVGIDATEDYPQMILSGDDNLQIDGVPIHSGPLNLTNTPIAWTHERHDEVGNIGLADGSAQQVTTPGLQQAFINGNTNITHLLIP